MQVFVGVPRVHGTTPLFDGTRDGISVAVIFFEQLARGLLFFDQEEINMSLMRKLTENRTKQRNTPVLRPRTT
jgi:hypothetical protein